MENLFGCAVTTRLVVVTMMYFSTYTSAVNLTYVCYPNTTLKVENPGDFTMVFANNSIRVCNTTWASGTQLVYIDNCRMDDDILVYFSYMDVAYSHIIGGSQSQAYAINCAQIPASGEFKTINVSMDVSIEELKMTTYPAFDPGFSIHSGIYADPMGMMLATEAIIGTPLFWIMKSNSDNYRIRPDQCWAYAGKNILDTVPSKFIYNYGCTLDESLVTNFLMYTYSRHEYGRRAILYSFGFYGSEYITMECKVRVCPFDSIMDDRKSFCETNLCANRKKRDFYDTAIGVKQVTVRAQFRTVPPSSGSERFGLHSLWLITLGIVYMRNSY